MRQTVRFHIAFFATLIVSAIMWGIGICDELTRILVSTLTVLMSYVAGDTAPIMVYMLSVQVIE